MARCLGFYLVRDSQGWYKSARYSRDGMYIACPAASARLHGKERRGFIYPLRTSPRSSQKFATCSAYLRKASSLSFPKDAFSVLCQIFFITPLLLQDTCWDRRPASGERCQRLNAKKVRRYVPTSPICSKVR